MKIITIWPESYELSPAVTFINGQKLATVCISRNDHQRKDEFAVQLGYKRSFVQTLTNPNNINLLENVENDSRIAKERRQKFFNLLEDYAEKEHSVYLLVSLDILKINWT